MDGERFDLFTRLFASRSTRRAAVRGLFAAVAGAAGFSESASAALVKRPPGAICLKNGDCASNICGPKDSTGRQYCQCTAPLSLCNNRTCVNLNTDLSNCGSCGHVCASGLTCTVGACCALEPSACGQNSPCCAVATCTTEAICCASGVSCGGACCQSAGSVCKNDECLSTFGGPCDDKFDCSTLQCENNVCVHSGFCAIDTDCEAGTCDGTRCENVPAGGPCIDKFSCTTLNCTNFICQQSIGGEFCGSDTDCLAGTCIQGKCGEVPAGGACFDKFSCNTLNCTNGVCQFSIGGEDCALTSDCSVGTCINGICANVPSGGACADKFGCISISCTGGVCD